MRLGDRPRRGVQRRSASRSSRLPQKRALRRRNQVHQRWQDESQGGTHVHELLSRSFQTFSFRQEDGEKVLEMRRRSENQISRRPRIFFKNHGSFGVFGEQTRRRSRRDGGAVR